MSKLARLVQMASHMTSMSEASGLLDQVQALIFNQKCISGSDSKAISVPQGQKFAIKRISKLHPSIHRLVKSGEALTSGSLQNNRMWIANTSTLVMFDPSMPEIANSTAIVAPAVHVFVNGKFCIVAHEQSTSVFTFPALAALEHRLTLPFGVTITSSCDGFVGCNDGSVRRYTLTEFPVTLVVEGSVKLLKSDPITRMVLQDSLLWTLSLGSVVRAYDTKDGQLKEVYKYKGSAVTSMIPTKTGVVLIRQQGKVVSIDLKTNKQETKDLYGMSLQNLLGITTMRSIICARGFQIAVDSSRNAHDQILLSRLAPKPIATLIRNLGVVYEVSACDTKAYILTSGGILEVYEKEDFKTIEEQLWNISKQLYPHLHLDIIKNKEEILDLLRSFLNEPRYNAIVLDAVDSLIRLVESYDLVAEDLPEHPFTLLIEGSSRDSINERLKKKCKPVIETEDSPLPAVEIIKPASPKPAVTEKKEEIKVSKPDLYSRNFNILLKESNLSQILEVYRINQVVSQCLKYCRANNSISALLTLLDMADEHSRIVWRSIAGPVITYLSDWILENPEEALKEQLRATRSSLSTEIRKSGFLE